MKIVMSGIIFALVLFVGFLLVKRIPAVQGFRECYALAYQVIDDRGLLLRTGDTEAALCETRKGILLRSAVCFEKVQKEEQIADGEREVIDRIAKMIAKGSKSFDELLMTHNEACADIRQHVRQDTVTGEWF
jgi:hypothetical protein